METHDAGNLTAWAAQFATADAASAARLRLVAGVRAAVVDDALWLRGDRWDAAVGRLIEQAAPDAVYRVDADGRLTPPGRLLAVGDLPAADWRPLADRLPVLTPPALSPAAVPARVMVRLARSDVERPATASRIDFDRFADWCDTAPSVRLGRLRFARRASEVLVLGDPLPPVAGVPHYASAGVVIPCGYALSPAVDPTSLRVRLRLSSGDLALFDEDGWHLVPAGAVAPVTRAGVRLTRLGAGA